MKRQLGTAQERLEELERMLKVDLKLISVIGTRRSRKNSKTRNSVILFRCTETISFL